MLITHVCRALLDVYFRMKRAFTMSHIMSSAICSESVNYLPSKSSHYRFRDSDIRGIVCIFHQKKMHGNEGSGGMGSG